ncbi:MAG TPA: nucleoside kinase [Thermoanaerobacterales bacterium]|nr:nucleoside kinase [Thermoanaerobacterales bacterium]
MRLKVIGFGEKILNEQIDLITLAEEYQEYFKSPIAAALVDNKLQELTYVLEQKDSTIKFLDLTSDIGMKIYVRTLTFLFIKACHDVFPDCSVHIEHSLGDGLYCEIYGSEPLTEECVEDIENRMRQMVEQDLPIKKKSMPTDEAIKMFREMGWDDKARILKYREEPEVNIYELDGMPDYFYGYMFPSTGHLKWFKLKFYLPGIVIQLPNKENPTKVAPYHEQPKLSRVFREAERWGRILGIADVGSLNDYILKGKSGDIIRVSEALHEKKVAEIADKIYRNRDRIRIILIAGPSSSGKTTFAQRLIVQLKVNGLRPLSISLDDYFVEREKTPLDEDGKPDFEALEAIDIKLFNNQLARLIQGSEVILPRYNFHTGEREYDEIPTKIKKDQPLIIEGIHGLNERLTASIPKENKYKIYVSALTQLNIDNHNRIPTTGTRLIRRIVRDSWNRSASAQKTISMWPQVMRGAEKNIFPFQEEADIMFNSALVYELAVLKKYAEPLLSSIRPGEAEYVVANHLLKFLDYFVPIEDERDIPLTSIIREFIGGCSFYNE